MLVAPYFKNNNDASIRGVLENPRLKNSVTTSNQICSKKYEKFYQNLFHTWIPSTSSVK